MQRSFFRSCDSLHMRGPEVAMASRRRNDAGHATGGHGELSRVWLHVARARDARVSQSRGDTRLVAPLKGLT